MQQFQKMFPGGQQDSLRAPDMNRRLFAFSSWEILCAIVLLVCFLTNRGASDYPRFVQENKSSSNLRDESLPKSASNRLGSLQFRHVDQPGGLAFCPSLNVLATTDDSGVNLWDLKSGKPLADLEGATRKRDDPSHRRLVFSTAAQLLCASTFDAKKGHEYLTFWSLKTGKIIAEVGTQRAALTSLSSSGDGKFIATADKSGKIRIWNALERKLVKEIQEVLPEKEYYELRIAASANGERVLTFVDYAISLWDAPTQKKLWRHESRSQVDKYYELALAPNGKIAIATAISTSKIFAWDGFSGKELYTVSLPNKARGSFVVFASDSQSFFVSCTDNCIRRYRASDGKEIDSIKANSPWLLAVDEESKRLAVLDKHYIRLWDLNARMEIIPQQGHIAKISSIAFSPDNKVMVSRAEDATIRIWQLENGRELLTLPEPKVGIPRVPYPIEWGYAPLSVSSSTVAFGRRDGIIEVSDLSSGKWSRQIKGDKSEISLVSLTEDKKRMIVTNVDMEINVWELATGKIAHSYKLPRPEKYLGCSFSITKDGRYLAYHQQTDIKPHPPLGLLGPAGFLGVYDLSAGKSLWHVDIASEAVLNRISISQDGKLLAAMEAGDGQGARIAIWEVESGKRIGQIPKPAERPGDQRSYGHTKCVCLCDKVNLVAVGLREGDIELWNIKTEKLIITLTGHKGPIECLTLSPDGHTLASGSADTTILLWDLRAATGQKEKAKGKGFSLRP